MQNTIKKFRFLFLCISGILTALTVVFPKAGFLEWITLVPMALVLLLISGDKSISLFKVYLHGSTFFMPFYLVIFHWFLYMYPMDFIEGMEKGVALGIVSLAWIGLSLIQTVTSSLIFLVFACILRCRAFERFKLGTPFLAGALWAVIEWSQTIGWWGVPWGRLCLGQTESSLNLLSASLFGSYFVTFLIVAVNFCLAYIFIKQEYVKVLSVACIAMIVGNLAIGCIVTLSYNNENNEKRTFAVVQGNITQDEKWGTDTINKLKEVHSVYTKQAASEGADIVVWAETAFPYDRNSSLEKYMSDLAKEADVTIIASSFVEPEEPIYDETSGRPRSYNCIYEVSRDGEIGTETYSKRHRVPFAEFLPMRSIVNTVFPPLAELNMIPDDVIPGEAGHVLHTKENGVIGGAICFDSVFEEITLDAVRNGAQVIIVATNDAWFGNSAENYMHTSQSKLRAIETGRYVVRAANKGISGIVDPLGKFEDRRGIDEEGLVMGEVYLRDQSTLYSIIGNTFVYACMAFCILCLCTSAVIYIKDKRADRRA